MVNKVLGAYVAADLIFVATGAIFVGFSVIVQNNMFVTPTDGTEAVRNLLYQQFPLTGTSNWLSVFYREQWILELSLTLSRDPSKKYTGMNETTGNANNMTQRASLTAYWSLLHSHSPSRPSPCLLVAGLNSLGTSSSSTPSFPSSWVCTCGFSRCGPRSSCHPSGTLRPHKSRT